MLHRFFIGFIDLTRTPTLHREGREARRGCRWLTETHEELVCVDHEAESIFLSGFIVISSSVFYKYETQSFIEGKGLRDVFRDDGDGVDSEIHDEASYFLISLFSLHRESFFSGEMA
jgi:hypothetical protein